MSLPFGLGSATYRASSADRLVAWGLYIQLQTRKAAIPFDADNDTLAEVFDSLYELFPLIRQLLVQLPLGEISRRDSIADLLLRVQNDGLRPHLTKWQASFRRWWELALADEGHADRSPQEIQRMFPMYAELVEDIQTMNAELTKYADELLKLARGESLHRPREVQPIAPTSHQ